MTANNSAAAMGRSPLSVWLTPENFTRLVLFALLLRIFLMPFFGHVDVLSEARRIYFWDEAGIYFDDISRNATSLWQLLFFKVFSVFIDNKDLLLAHADMTDSTARPNEYFEFISQGDIFRTLFVIKLPFLAADLITAWALFRFCGSDHGARRAVVFWLLNPITIFAFYIFGRFESIPVMFAMLALLALQRERLIISAILVGLSINSRELFIFLGPVFVALVCSPAARQYSWRAKAAAVAVVVFATAVSVQLISLTGGAVDAFGRPVSSLATEGRVEYLFRFIVGSFLIFPMVIFSLLLYSWNNKSELLETATLMFAFTIIAFFLFSSHTAHYTSWLVVFACIYYARNPDMLKPLIMLCLTWFIYNLSITDLGVFTTWLASPWSIHLSGLPNFPMLYNALGLGKTLDLLTFSRVCRTLYNASILYLVVQMTMLYIARRRTNAGGGA